MTSADPSRPGNTRRAEPPASDSAGARRGVLLLGGSGFLAFTVVCFVSFGNPYPAERADLWWNALMAENRTEAGLAIAWVAAVVGGPIPMLVIGVLLVAGFLFLRWKVIACTVGGAMILSVALASPLAAIVAKDRPQDSLAETVPTSFPSGHTAMAATVGVILALVFRHWIAWLLAIAWIILMGWSRTYLQAHWLMDVFAGACLGVVAGATVWLVSDVVSRRRIAATRAPDLDSAG